MARDQRTHPFTTDQGIQQELAALKHKLDLLERGTTTTIQQKAVSAIDDPLNGELVIDPTDNEFKWYFNEWKQFCPAEVEIALLRILRNGSIEQTIPIPRPALLWTQFEIYIPQALADAMANYATEISTEINCWFAQIGQIGNRTLQIVQPVSGPLHFIEQLGVEGNAIIKNVSPNTWHTVTVQVSTNSGDNILSNIDGSSATGTPPSLIGEPQFIVLQTEFNFNALSFEDKALWFRNIKAGSTIGGSNWINFNESDIDLSDFEYVYGTVTFESTGPT